MKKRKNNEINFEDFDEYLDDDDEMEESTDAKNSNEDDDDEDESDIFDEDDEDDEQEGILQFGIKPIFIIIPVAIILILLLGFKLYTMLAPNLSDSGLKEESYIEKVVRGNYFAESKLGFNGYVFFDFNEDGSYTGYSPYFLEDKGTYEIVTVSEEGKEDVTSINIALDDGKTCTFVCSTSDDHPLVLTAQDGTVFELDYDTSKPLIEIVEEEKTIFDKNSEELPQDKWTKDYVAANYDKVFEMDTKKQFHFDDGNGNAYDMIYIPGITDDYILDKYDKATEGQILGYPFFTDRSFSEENLWIKIGDEEDNFEKIENITLKSIMSDDENSEDANTEDEEENETDSSNEEKEETFLSDTPSMLDCLTYLSLENETDIKGAKIVDNETDIVLDTCCITGDDGKILSVYMGLKDLDPGSLSQMDRQMRKNIANLASICGITPSMTKYEAESVIGKGGIWKAEDNKLTITYISNGYIITLNYVCDADKVVNFSDYEEFAEIYEKQTKGVFGTFYLESVKAVDKGFALANTDKEKLVKIKEYYEKKENIDSNMLNQLSEFIGE